MKIIVTGGNGFIGLEICRVAVEEKAEVISVSRSGIPQKNAPWMKHVTWIAANIFDTKRWADALEGADALIHTIGIIREKPERDITFERMNGESTIVAAKAVVAAGVPTFVMMSASDAPPFFKRYIRAKRIAESFLEKQSFRSVIMRPGLVYGSQRKGSTAIALLTRAGSRIPLLGRFIRKYRPVHVSELARAVINCVKDMTIHGIVDLDAIKQFSQENMTMEEPS
jgi:uncharacterized protein YbjT (DUF2867 family)